MGLFEQWPYTNLHTLNLDWILESLKELEHTIEQFVAINALKYADPIQWNIVSQYEKNTIVIDPLTGTAYISVQPVPSGVALTRDEYWTVVFDLGGFVVRAAKNFTSRHEDVTTLTATFPTPEGDWLVWGDVLYRAKVNITAGDQYVVDSNIEHFTMEQILGHIEDLTTTDKSNIVAAINEVLTTLVNTIGALTDLNTTDKSNIVAAINEVISNIGALADLNTTDKSNIVAAINEVIQSVADTIGALTDLNTTDQSNIVAAINEVIGNIGALSDLDTRDQSNIVAAINEVKADLKIVNALDYGVVGDGVTDDTTAIMDWLSAVRSACITNGTRVGYVRAYLPSGVYLVSSRIDLSLYFEAGGISFEYLYFDMGNAEFKIDSSFSDSVILNIAPAGTSQFIHCQFDIGCVLGLTTINNLSNIRMYNVNDSVINIKMSMRCKIAALHLDQSSAMTDKRGIFNNIFNITGLGYGEYGLLSTSDPNDSLYAVQGNIFNITHIFNNHHGIDLDFALSYSNLNQFHIGAIEFNSGVGVIDNSGNNMFFIDSCNGQTDDFFLQNGARPDYVIGSFAGNINLHNIPCRFTNLAASTGLRANQPVLPGAGVEFYNPYNQLIQVHVYGDTLSGVYINSNVFAQDSVNGHLDVTVLMQPQDKISMIYDPNDTTMYWKWFGL